MYKGSKTYIFPSATKFIQLEVKMKAAACKWIDSSCTCAKIAFIIIIYFGFFEAVLSMGVV